MKKILFVIMIMCVVVSSSSFVLAEEKSELIISNAVATSNTETVDVTLSIHNNPGICSAKISIEFDNDIFQLVNVSDSEMFGSTSHSPLLDSPYNLYWNNGTAKENYLHNGIMATFTFKIKEQSEAGKYPVRVTYEDDNILNVDLDNVFFETKDGYIEIVGQENNKSHTSSKSVSGGKIKQVETKEKAVVDNKDNQIILTINSKIISVFGKNIENDVAPIIRKDRTMLPVRLIAENLGAIVNWYDNDRKVEIIQDNKTILIFIDSSVAKVNNENINLDSPAFIENDRTYLPIRFISENLGAKVEWNEKNQEVIITK